jgi:hypothetical protein
LGPISPTTSPSAISKDRLLTASSLPNHFVICFTLSNILLRVKALLHIKLSSKESIGNYRGDLPELFIENNHINFKKIPTMVVVRPTLSKAGHTYLIFLTSEGCSYLKSYLNERLAKGETLNSDTPIIAVKLGYDVWVL